MGWDDLQRGLGAARPWGSQLRRVGADLVGDLIDAVWPARCWLCGAALAAFDGGGGEVLACAEHALDRTLGGNRCGRCAATLAPGLRAGMQCRSCGRRPPRFRSVHAADDYGRGAVRSWILAFKHGGRRDLAVPLAARLAHSLADLSRPCDGHGRILVPVPLHPVRLVERGYDQASLLACELARHGFGPSVPLLRRSRSTPPQGSELAQSRSLNVRDAFRCRLRLPQGTVVGLVDDVLASGATADACAAALRRAGAAEVHVLVIARA